MGAIHSKIDLNFVKEHDNLQISGIEYENFMNKVYESKDINLMIDARSIQKEITEKPTLVIELIKKIRKDIKKLNQNKENAKIAEKKRLFGGIKLLTRIISFIFGSEIKNEATKLFIEIQEGKSLIEEIIELLFISKLTISNNIEEYLMVDNGKTSLKLTEEKKMNIEEILNLILSLIISWEYNLGQFKKSPILFLITKVMKKEKLTSLFYLLISIISSYKLTWITWGQSQTIVEVSVQILVFIILNDYEEINLNDENCSYIRLIGEKEFFDKIETKKGSSSQFLIDGLYKNNNFREIIEGSAELINSSYNEILKIFSFSKELNISHELLVLYTIFVINNEGIGLYLLDSPNFTKILVSITYYAVVSHLRVKYKSNTNYIFWYFLHKLADCSVETFSKRINEQIKRPIFLEIQGNYADLLISALYLLLKPEKDCKKRIDLETINMGVYLLYKCSAYLKFLSFSSCNKLLEIFKFYISSSRKMEENCNYIIFASLIAKFITKILIYKPKENIAMLYCIIYKKEIFLNIEEKISSVHKNSGKQNKSNDKYKINNFLKKLNIFSIKKIIEIAYPHVEEFFAENKEKMYNIEPSAIIKYLEGKILIFPFEFTEENHDDFNSLEKDISFNSNMIHWLKKYVLNAIIVHSSHKLGWDLKGIN